MSDRKPTQLTHDLRLHCSYTLPGTYRPPDRPFWHVTCSSNFVYEYFMSILTRTLSPPDPTGTVLSDHPALLARYIQRARRAGCSGFIPAHAHLPEPARLARRPVWHATPASNLGGGGSSCPLPSPRGYGTERAGHTNLFHMRGVYFMLGIRYVPLKLMPPTPYRKLSLCPNTTAPQEGLPVAYP